MDHAGEKETTLRSGDEGDPIHTGVPSKGNSVNLLQPIHPNHTHPDHHLPRGRNNAGEDIKVSSITLETVKTSHTADDRGNNWAVANERFRVCHGGSEAGARFGVVLLATPTF
jgi:hypothetical protein